MPLFIFQTFFFLSFFSYLSHRKKERRRRGKEKEKGHAFILWRRNKSICVWLLGRRFFKLSWREENSFRGVVWEFVRVCRGVAAGGMYVYIRSPSNQCSNPMIKYYYKMIGWNKNSWCLESRNFRGLKTISVFFLLSLFQVINYNHIRRTKLAVILN